MVQAAKVIEAGNALFALAGTGSGIGRLYHQGKADCRNPCFFLGNYSHVLAALCGAYCVLLESDMLLLLL